MNYIVNCNVLLYYNQDPILFGTDVFKIYLKGGVLFAMITNFAFP